MAARKTASCNTWRRNTAAALGDTVSTAATAGALMEAVDSFHPSVEAEAWTVLCSHTEALEGNVKLFYGSRLLQHPAGAGGALANKFRVARHAFDSPPGMGAEWGEGGSQWTLLPTIADDSDAALTAEAYPLVLMDKQCLSVALSKTQGAMRIETLLGLWSNVAFPDAPSVGTDVDRNLDLAVPLRVTLQFTTPPLLDALDEQDYDREADGGPEAGSKRKLQAMTGSSSTHVDAVDALAVRLGEAPFDTPSLAMLYARLVSHVTVRLEVNHSRLQRAFAARAGAVAAKAMARALLLVSLQKQVPQHLAGRRPPSALDADDVLPKPMTVRVQPSPAQSCTANLLLQCMSTNKYDIHLLPDVVGLDDLTGGRNALLLHMEPHPHLQWQGTALPPVGRPRVMERVVLDSSVMGAGKTWPPLLAAAARAALDLTQRLRWFTAASGSCGGESTSSAAPLHFAHRRTALTVPMNGILVVAPTHMLRTWDEQVKAVAPTLKCITVTDSSMLRRITLAQFMAADVVVVNLSMVGTLFGVIDSTRAPSDRYFGTTHSALLPQGWTQGNASVAVDTPWTTLVASLGSPVRSAPPKTDDNPQVAARVACSTHWLLQNSAWPLVVLDEAHLPSMQGALAALPPHAVRSCLSASLEGDGLAETLSNHRKGAIFFSAPPTGLCDFINSTDPFALRALVLGERSNPPPFNCRVEHAIVVSAPTAREAALLPGEPTLAMVAFPRARLVGDGASDDTTLSMTHDQLVANKVTVLQREIDIFGVQRTETMTQIAERRRLLRTGAVQGLAIVAEFGARIKALEATLEQQGRVQQKTQDRLMYWERIVAAFAPGAEQECPICIDTKPAEGMALLPDCGHVICVACLPEVETAARNSRVAARCPCCRNQPVQWHPVVIKADADVHGSPEMGHLRAFIDRFGSKVAAIVCHLRERAAVTQPISTDAPSMLDWTPAPRGNATYAALLVVQNDALRTTMAHALRWGGIDSVAVTGAFRQCSTTLAT
jgi:hypothetical protein